METVRIVGDSDSSLHDIYELCNSRIMVRKAKIKTKKGGDPVKILHFTDLHLNKMSDRDFEEKEPSVMSTRQYRMAFRNESTVSNAEKSLELVPFFDKTVITGDIVDYLTWGSLDLVKKMIWDKYSDILMPLGGHDYTRCMEGDIDDLTSEESRLDILKEYWKHDLFYTSEIIKDKVMIVAMLNDMTYFDFQVEKLEKDIEFARDNDLIILIFQHEPICTKNEKEKDLKAIRVNDRASSSIDFYTRFHGGEKSSKASKAMHSLITESADVIKGIFCGHLHSDYYTEVIAGDTIIRQYVLTGNMYDEGHIMIIEAE